MGLIDSEKMLKDFPILKRKINGKRLVYLDSAATSLTPEPVIERMDRYYRESNANVHRGINTLGEEATEIYESAHKDVERFINADSGEVIFTKNTTESINLVARTLCRHLAYPAGRHKKKAGEKTNIVLTEMEHHSNLVPWQQMAKRYGFELRYIPVTDEGILDMDAALDIIDEDTAIVSLVYLSNFLGTVNPVKMIAEEARKTGAFIMVDAAQSAPHLKLDVKDIGADFVAFSGHKMLGPTGIGVLYGRKKILDEMEPFLYGGGMIKEVEFDNTTFADLPWKYEAGTPNIAGAAGLSEAIRYLDGIGMDNISKHTEMLARQCFDMMEDLDEEISIYGPEDRAGLVSFNMKNIHAHDISSVMDQEGITIRGGHHCVMPLHHKMGLSGSCRASFHIYNDEKDIESLRKGLIEAGKVFSR